MGNQVHVFTGYVKDHSVIVMLSTLLIQQKYSIVLFKIYYHLLVMMFRREPLMQAVVCTNVVGWREDARKVLLVLTDAIMHTAGDGRLAGIYTPNDGQCHTQFDSVENGIYYSDSTKYMTILHLNK